MEEILLTIIENNKNLSSQLTSTMQKFVRYIIDKETTNGVLDLPKDEKFDFEEDYDMFVGGSIFFDKFSKGENDICVELYNSYTNLYIDTIGFDELNIKTQYTITKFLFDLYISNRLN